MNFGLILFTGAFNSRRRLNDVGLNLVELRATKGGEVAAFRRSFRFVGFPDVLGGRLEGGGKKRRESGLKWGLGRVEGEGEVQDGCLGLYLAAHGACGGCLAGCSSTVAQNGV